MENTNYFWDKIRDKEKLKKEFIKISLFIGLYENFKKIWKDRLYTFYADTVDIDENNNLRYWFSMPNPSNPKAYMEGDFIKDSEAENKFYNEVYRTVKKANGKDWDYEASLFKWLYSRDIIEKYHYDKLIEIRNTRNIIVHEFDKLLFEGLPHNFETLFEDFLVIRKYSSKQWYINVELATDMNAPLDENGQIHIPDEVISGENLIYDIVCDVVLK